MTDTTTAPSLVDTDQQTAHVPPGAQGPSEPPQDPWQRHERAMKAADRVLSRPSATRSMRSRLADLVEAAETVHDLSEPPDVYGDGVVAALERRVANLLGKESAVFFPTGTMAQQVVLRCWAERSGNRTVGLHALSHPEVFEAGAFPKVSGLRTVRLAAGPHQISADDVASCREELGALMLELPLRDAGYVLPTWDELVAVTRAARDKGVVVHLDGARLWDCTPHFGRPLEEIAALADTVYVSCYKSLDAMSGALVAGDAAIVDEVRVWRHRYGGRVFQQYPAALATLVGLDRELPRLPEYVAHAKVVAAGMADGFRRAGVPWFQVLPAEPHIQQFQVWLPHSGEALTDAATRQAEEAGTAIFQMPWWEPGVPPGLSVTEVTAGGAALAWSREDVASATADFARRIIG